VTFFLSLSLKPSAVQMTFKLSRTGTSSFSSSPAVAAVFLLFFSKIALKAASRPLSLGMAFAGESG
jgi:hypothetical protein